jgi:hypothetical protein
MPAERLIEPSVPNRSRTLALPLCVSGRYKILPLYAFIRKANKHTRLRMIALEVNGHESQTQHRDRLWFLGIFAGLCLCVGDESRHGSHDESQSNRNENR